MPGSVATVPKVAARLMLSAFGRYDNTGGDGAGKFQDATRGLLTDDDLKAIAGEVWKE